MPDSIDIFERYAKEYDEWFEKYPFVYQTEIEALKKHIPEKGQGLEIGVGTGRFAKALGIRAGIEPAKSMLEIAKKRGLEVYQAKAEKLPFTDNTFDFVLMMTTLCFVEDPFLSLSEAKRVLKPSGTLIIGLIDKNSFLGKIYDSQKENKFYKYSKFYSIEEVLEWLEKLNFNNFKIYQTLFSEPKDLKKIDTVKDGYGEGGFVSISARK